MLYFFTTIEIGRELIKNEGFSALYRGYTAAIMIDAPAGAIWWSVYETMKRILSDNDPRSILFDYKPKALEETMGKSNHYVQNHFAQSLAGVSAGIVTSIVVNPLDVVKTRLQTQSRAAGEVYYTNVYSGLKYMIKTEGMQAIWKGLAPRITSTIPVCAFGAIVYEYLLKACRRKKEEV